jgi:hypothetical protein
LLIKQTSFSYLKTDKLEKCRQIGGKIVKWVYYCVFLN